MEIISLQDKKDDMVSKLDEVQTSFKGLQIKNNQLLQHIRFWDEMATVESNMHATNIVAASIDESIENESLTPAHEMNKMMNYFDKRINDFATTIQEEIDQWPRNSLISISHTLEPQSRPSTQDTAPSLQSLQVCPPVVTPHIKICLHDNCHVEERNDSEIVKTSSPPLALPHFIVATHLEIPLQEDISLKAAPNLTAQDTAPHNHYMYVIRQYYHNLRFTCMTILPSMIKDRTR